MRMLKICAALFVLLGSQVHAAAPKPVKVFILAGQSNMEGKAKVKLLEYQIQQPVTRDLFAALQKDGKWLQRNDVWIKFLDRKGKLTVGYGSPGCIGPELGFGMVVGDRYDEPVLLIKTAWGGRSLWRDFRPPSAGMPADSVLEKMLADARKRKPETTMEQIKEPFGASYREMIKEVNSTLGNLKTLFPEYQGQGYELAGMVWFQGWNDMINDQYTAQYAENFAHFVQDVRKDFHAPALPIVVGQMGVGGSEPDAHVRKFKEAQAAAQALPQMSNVVLVKTDPFWDTTADATFKKGWRQNQEEWDKVGSDYPYHYLGSVKTMYAIGRAFGDAMLRLRGEEK